MITSLQPSSAQTPRSRVADAAPAHAENGPADAVRSELEQLIRMTQSVARGLLLMLGVLPFALPIIPEAQSRSLAFAIVAACVSLLLMVVWQLPSIIAFSADVATTALLLAATDSAGSPYLCLPLLLVLLGALAGGKHLALAGGGIAALLLTLLGVSEPDAPQALIAVLIALTVATAFGAAWLCDLLFTALELRDDSSDGTHSEAPPPAPIAWAEIGAALLASTDRVSLIGAASEQAALIGRCAAQVQLFDGAQGRPAPTTSYATVPIAGAGINGLITLHQPADTLEPALREALAHLASLIALKAATLQSAALLQRQDAALEALWETAGLLRLAPDLRGALQEASSQMAAALGLDWLAVLAPAERRGVAPLAIAAGLPGAPAPQLSGAQMRVAIETLQTDRPLVRTEAGTALICLPIRPEGACPLALAARGGSGDAAAQLLLMLFGGLLADQIEARSTLSHMVAPADARTYEHSPRYALA